MRANRDEPRRRSVRVRRKLSAIVILGIGAASIGVACGSANPSAAPTIADSSTSTGLAPPPATPSAPAPKVVGLTLTKAKSQIAKLPVDVRVTVTKQFSSKAPGTVLSQTPAASESVYDGEAITLVIAKPSPRVPSVVGKSLSAAKKTLKEAGFSIKVKHQVSSASPGTVIAQTPRGGRRRKPGTPVTLTVAKAAPAASPSPPSPNCTPGYSPCLPLGPSDYDCYGGSGNGPAYTAPGVTYRVTGSDPYGLDSDHDGYGCE